MTIEMIIKRATEDRTLAALKALSVYIPKIKKNPLLGSKVWYKKPFFWFLIIFISGIGLLYATKRYHGIDPLKLLFSLIFKAKAK